jgi:hypothetical protein
MPGTVEPIPDNLPLVIMSRPEHLTNACRFHGRRALIEHRAGVPVPDGVVEAGEWGCSDFSVVEVCVGREVAVAVGKAAVFLDEPR